jgi:hypothetical protein
MSINNNNIKTERENFFSIDKLLIQASFMIYLSFATVLNLLKKNLKITILTSHSSQTKIYYLVMY